jgi:hypothetical protein
MTVELEQRLENLGDALPTPSETARAEARARALAALPPALRRPYRRRLGLVALSGAAVAVLALLLATPWDDRSPLATERALAALGDRPVIHAVVESEQPHTTIVEVDSGQERPQFMRTEYWYDDERSLLRSRFTIDGHLLTELLQTREGALSDLGPVSGNPVEPHLDPALAGFASGYREALESGEARVAGKTGLDGREVILLQIALPSRKGRPPTHEEVAIDAESYRPLRFRFHFGEDTSNWWRVVSIATVDREEGQFAPPPVRTEPHHRGQTWTDEQTVTPAEAATALERPAVWAGESVGDVALSEIEVMKLTTEWTDGRETETRALSFQYGERPRGRAGGRWLRVTESTSKEMSRFGSFGAAPLAPGELRLVGLGGEGEAMIPMLWFGVVDLDGLYLGFESPQRDLILEAARALRPLRGG